jgi:hypothetical protein
MKKGVGSGVGSGSGSISQRSGPAPKCHGSPTLENAQLHICGRKGVVGLKTARKVENRRLAISDDHCFRFRARRNSWSQFPFPGPQEQLVIVSVSGPAGTAGHPCVQY